MSRDPSKFHGDDAAKVGETSANANANAMKKSLIDEGLLILKSCPKLVSPESFTNHFKIIEGLCDLLHITVKSADSTYKLIKIRDIMIRIEKQVSWISFGTKLYSQEIQQMNDCFYKDNFEGILSWAAKVKTANKNHAVKIDAYFKLVEMKSDWETLFGDWNGYMENLTKDWGEKKILVYVKKNTALELRSLAESTRDHLWKMGLISKSLLMDLKKFQDGDQYYYITANVLSDTSFSPTMTYYYGYFDKANNLFTNLLSVCEPKESAPFGEKEWGELLELLEVYMEGICGTKICNMVSNLKQSLITKNYTRIKPDIDDLKAEFEKLFEMIEKYFEVGEQIISYEAIECWVKLEVPGSGSDNANNSDPITQTRSARKRKAEIS